MTNKSATVAQNNKFVALTNDLLLRIRSFQTDSNTLQFLQKYVPILAKKPEPGGWTAYPPDEDPIPEKLTIHSLLFSKHPFVDIGIQEGRLDVLTREQNDMVVGFRNYYITLLFNSKQMAEQAFDKFCTMFTPLSTSQKIVSSDTKKVAVFTHEDTNAWEEQVQFVLSQDDLFDNRYKIIFGQILDPDLNQHYGIAAY